MVSWLGEETERVDEAGSTGVQKCAAYMIRMLD
jgi:hypothetical protein